MAAITQRSFFNLTAFKSFTPETTTRHERRKFGANNSVKCSQTVEGSTQSVTLSNGKDSLAICRVLNGMWQTSGGWGKIDRHDAVEAMLRYADAGLSTFDMADHCTYCKDLGNRNPHIFEIKIICQYYHRFLDFVFLWSSWYSVRFDRRTALIWPRSLFACHTFLKILGLILFYPFFHGGFSFEP